MEPLSAVMTSLYERPVICAMYSLSTLPRLFKESTNPSAGLSVDISVALSSAEKHLTSQAVNPLQVTVSTCFSFSSFRTIFSIYSSYSNQFLFSNKLKFSTSLYVYHRSYYSSEAYLQFAV